MLAIPQKSKQVALGQQERAVLAGFPGSPAWVERERCDQEHQQACVSEHQAEPFFTPHLHRCEESEVGEGASSASQFQQGSVASPSQGTPPSSCWILVGAPGLLAAGELHLFVSCFWAVGWGPPQQGWHSFLWVLLRFPGSTFGFYCNGSHSLSL